MNENPSDSGTLSSDSAKTPDAKPFRAKQLCNSPTLRAFEAFDDVLADLYLCVLLKTAAVATDDKHLLRTELENLEVVCKRTQLDFDQFTSKLDEAIEKFEAKKPTDLVEEGNRLNTSDKQTAKRTTIDNEITIAKIATALSVHISRIYGIVNKKVHKSIYEDYSFSVAKKLQNLKFLCEAMSKDLQRYREIIQNTIDQNEQVSF